MPLRSYCCGSFVCFMHHACVFSAMGIFALFKMDHAFIKYLLFLPWLYKSFILPGFLFNELTGILESLHII